MSEEHEEHEEQEEESSQDEALEVVDESELDEVDEEDEIDDIAEAKEVPVPEKGACMVLGQGDMEGIQANRGADDPGDNTLEEPQFICKFGEMVFVSDRGNHRVLLWDTNPEEIGEPSSVVLGQEDFADCLENRGMTTTLDEMTSGLGDENLDGFTISKCEDDSMSQPAGVCVIDGKLYVADSGNHRVLRWGGLPSEDGELPAVVLGQDSMDCNEANRRGIISSGSLFFPMGICSGDDQHVFVADKDNHRILIWKKIPFGDGWNADVTLGQVDMDGREPNRGDFENVTQDSLSFPTGVHFDPETGKLFVVDQGNNRVLIWNKVPSEWGTRADVVVGQKDFLSRGPNAELGYKRSSEHGLYFPTDVVVGKIGMFVSDTQNNRVLYWKEVPTENGQPADLVLGQKNFYENQFNRNGQPTHATFNDPFGLFLEEWEEDEEDEGLREPLAVEEDEDEESENQELVKAEEGAEEEEQGPKIKFKLYVADRGNSRVVLWDELPKPPKSEEDLDGEDREWETDDPNAVMGEDEGDDYLLEEGKEEEEEEEDSPEGLPSA